MSEPGAPIRRQPLNSLSTKIIFFVFLSTFLTALAVSWISIESTYRFLRRRIDQSFPAVLDRSAARLDAWLAERRSELVDTGEYLATELGGGTALGAPLHEALARASGAGHDRSLVVLPRGAGGAGGGAPMLDGIPAALWSELAAAEGPTTRIHVPPEGPATVLIAVPLGGGGGPPAATLVASFPAAGLAALLVSDPGLSGPHMHLVDPGGRSIASSEHGAAGARIALPPLDAATVSEYASPSGERFLGAARPLGETGALLVVDEPFEAAFEPVLSVVTRIFVTDLGIIFLFSFLAYQITAAIVKPIEALSEGARRVSQGELDVEIPDTRGNDEIGLLTRTFNDMMRKLRKNQLEIESANRQLKDQNEALQRGNEVLAQLSITDGLTKLHNHRFFQDHLTRELKRVQRTGEPLAMLLVDIDDFKRLNDRLGHAAGDEMLVRIARIMNETMRESDLLARYGGEEFVVLASGTDLRGAATLAEKVRGAVAESTFLLDDSHRLERITISIGVAQFKGDRKGFFQGADRALYRAKAAGKNCVRVDEVP
jgi:diguanylate cyclase (GGDEF)-like protein